jgi:hypothetical protein
MLTKLGLAAALVGTLTAAYSAPTSAWEGRGGFHGGYGVHVGYAPRVIAPRYAAPIYAPPIVAPVAYGYGYNYAPPVYRYGAPRVVVAPRWGWHR